MIDLSAMTHHFNVQQNGNTKCAVLETIPLKHTFVIKSEAKLSKPRIETIYLNLKATS